MYGAIVRIAANQHQLELLAEQEIHQFTCLA